MQTVKPRVAIVSPRRTVVRADDPGELDLERLDAIAPGLASLGFDVVRDPGPWRNVRRFGGTDAERADEFGRYLCDGSVDVVLPVRGGYGMARILERLPWKAIEERRPVAMGFSDFTAFNLALFAKTGLPSWQGPTAGRFALGRTDSRTARYFLRALASPGWSLGWKAPAPAAGFRAEGLLWGGNLSIIVSLIGTPWFPDPGQTRGGILFLEDVGEPAYSVDRMLTQLLQAGVLAQQRAVVFGSFSGTERYEKGERDFRLCDALEDIARKLRSIGVESVQGLPFGHLVTVPAVPFGVRGELAVSETGEASLSAEGAPALSRGRQALLDACDALSALDGDAP